MPNEVMLSFLLSHIHLKFSFPSLNDDRSRGIYQMLSWKKAITIQFHLVWSQCPHLIKCLSSPLSLISTRFQPKRFCGPWKRSWVASGILSPLLFLLWFQLLGCQLGKREHERGKKWFCVTSILLMVLFLAFSTSLYPKCYRYSGVGPLMECTYVWVIQVAW